MVGQVEPFGDKRHTGEAEVDLLLQRHIERLDRGHAMGVALADIERIPVRIVRDDRVRQAAGVSIRTGDEETPRQLGEPRQLRDVRAIEILDAVDRRDLRWAVEGPEEASHSRLPRPRVAWTRFRVYGELL